jgi:uncharacterized membrane protein YkvA (DUF1232 family)
MKRLLGGPIARWFNQLLRNPKYRWFVIFGSLLYLVSPLDISPDVFPIIGWIDDGLLATIVVTELSQMALEKRRSSTSSEKQDDTSETFSENVIDVEAYPVG